MVAEVHSGTRLIPTGPENYVLCHPGLSDPSINPLSQPAGWGRAARAACAMARRRTPEGADPEDAAQAGEVG